MALPNLEAQVRTVSEAAQNFVDSYYEALNKRKDTSGFYSSTSAKLTAAGVIPDISINGHVIPATGGGPEPQVKLAQSLLVESRGPNISYEVGSFDAHPVNGHYAVGADAANNSGSNLSSKAERISFAVQVSGTVKYGKGQVGDDGYSEQAFTEAWLLVPHWEAQGPKAPRGLRKWVVVSQNFRAL